MDELDRMYRLLVRNVRAAAPDYLSRPFEIAELYQSLIPYRHHRRELALETNEDYEITMTRLLAGERGYLVTEPAVREALQRELGTTNPDPSAFRQYAHAQVVLDPGMLRAAGGDGAGSSDHARAAAGSPAWGAGTQPPAPPMRPTPPAPPPMPTREPHGGPTAASAPPPMPPMPVREPVRPPQPPAAVPQPPRAPIEPALATAGKTPTTVEGGGTCRHCGGRLPDGRRITFCPHCGQNLTIRNCPACGTELEVGWKFCVTCGRANPD